MTRIKHTNILDSAIDQSSSKYKTIPTQWEIEWTALSNSAVYRGSPLYNPLYNPALVPENKHDSTDRIPYLLANTSSLPTRGSTSPTTQRPIIPTTTIIPILPDLLEWCQDPNWPSSRIVPEFLLRYPSHLVPLLRKIVQGDDDEWINTILQTLVRKLPDKDFDKLRGDLEALSGRYYREGEEQIGEGEGSDGKREDDCGLIEWVEEILEERGQKKEEEEKEGSTHVK